MLSAQYLHQSRRKGLVLQCPDSTVVEASTSVMLFHESRMQVSLCHDLPSFAEQGGTLRCN
jgi:hypothetical protein